MFVISNCHISLFVVEEHYAYINGLYNTSSAFPCTCSFYNISCNGFGRGASSDTLCLEGNYVSVHVCVLWCAIRARTGFGKKVCWGKPGPLRFGCSDCTGPDGDNGMSFCQLLGWLGSVCYLLIVFHGELSMHRSVPAFYSCSSDGRLFPSSHKINEYK